MSDIDSMWFCKTCEAWNGTELPRCLECDRERPLFPVTSDSVPVSDSKNVTFWHRIDAKIGYCVGKVK
jgi:hypothetical protein